MQAILMAGGKGTRLRPYTAIIPKPLVPIEDIPIIELVLRQLKYYGFKNIIISVGHKAEILMAVIGNGKRFGLDISYYIEDTPLGTIGSLASIDGLEENFLVMNGDICTNLNYQELFNYHVSGGFMATIGSYKRKERIELGVIKTGTTNSNEIIEFKEKPEYDYLVSMGVNAFNRSILDLIPKNQFFGFDSLMKRLLDDKIKIRTFCFEGRWLDVGRPDDYDKMCIDFKDNPSVYLPPGA